MAKCMHCGKSTLIYGHVKLKDGIICTPCFKSFGFKIKDASLGSVYTYEELLERNNPSPTLLFANYGQERDLAFTEQEESIFDIVRSLCDDNNLDSEKLRLVHKSNDYASIVMDSSSGYGLLDVMRVKFTERAKWVKIGPEFEKIQISDPEDVVQYTEQIWAAYEYNVPYL